VSKTVVLFGPPGCGKGTQAARLKESLGVPHISTGDMFRDHKARKTDLGTRVQEVLDRGELVPDEITNAMVEERLGREDVAEGALLDGYPRNPDQARELDRVLAARGRAVDAVIVMEVPAEEVTRRLIERGKQSGRADDQDPATIRNRLEVYREQSEPCVAFYAEHHPQAVRRVDGVGTIDAVTERILKSLNG